MSNVIPGPRSIYEFHVEMTCEGCSSALKRIMDRHLDKGIGLYNIDLGTKTVKVESPLSSDEVAKILEKCGKEVSFRGIIPITPITN